MLVSLESMFQTLFYIVREMKVIICKGLAVQADAFGQLQN